jgi:hypothetical protein
MWLLRWLSSFTDVSYSVQVDPADIIYIFIYIYIYLYITIYMERGREGGNQMEEGWSLVDGERKKGREGERVWWPPCWWPPSSPCYLH